MRTYSIRVPDNATAGVTSEQMRACLKGFFVSGGVGGVAPDTSAGEIVIRRTLPENLVVKFSAALGERESTALRRLALTCVRVLPAAAQPRALPATFAQPKPEPGFVPLTARPENRTWRDALVEPAAPSVPVALRPKPESISPWRTWWDQTWPHLAVPLVFALIFLVRTSWSSRAAGSVGPSFPAWTPE